jgi:drug/metabolite transporter (DMT)-like permease
MLAGVGFALAAGLMWGLVFVGPLMLPEYPAAWQVVGRYLAFGMLAVPLAWMDRNELRQLSRADWLEAFKLTLIGNFLYYMCLASAIKRAGAPLPTMVIGTLPVVISISANILNRKRDGVLPWHQLVPCIAVISLGIGLVNHVEMSAVMGATQSDFSTYLTGAALALCAVVCWTWYPLRNAAWLRQHADRSPRVWATAQGFATLPVALIGFLLLALAPATTDQDFPKPFGPRPIAFIGLMLAIGFFASWLGTRCWNEASQRLPTALAGQLIVFETLAALAYAFLLRGALPHALTLAGIALLILGVVAALRIQPSKAAVTNPPAQG